MSIVTHVNPTSRHTVPAFPQGTIRRGLARGKARRMTTTAQHSARALPRSDFDGVVLTPRCRPGDQRRVVPDRVNRC